MSADFIDTNVFVYLFDETDARKREIAKRLVTNGIATGTGVISFQVVQETLNVLTRRLNVNYQDSRKFLEAVLDPLWAVPPSAELYGNALDLAERYRYSFYDSLIIASALAANAERLLSEDLQDGQKIGGVLIENPFA